MIPKRNCWSCWVASGNLQSQNTIFISWSNIKLSWSTSDCPLPLSRRKLSISNSILALRGICSTQNSGSVSNSDWLTNQWHFKTLISTIPNSHGNVIFQIAIILIQIEISLTIISQWNMLAASTLTITFSFHANCQIQFIYLFSHSCDVCGQVYSTEVALQTHMLKPGISKPLYITWRTDGLGSDDRSVGFVDPWWKHDPELANRFPCDVCGKTFSTEMNFKNHRRLTHEKTIQCPLCPEKFKRNINLESHLSKFLVDLRGVWIWMVGHHGNWWRFPYLHNAIF